jgi:hypothetical protein
MKTLVCPKCHNVYKKSNKFIYSLYICVAIFVIVVSVLTGDNLFVSIGYGLVINLFLWVFLIYYLNIDILDLIILTIGLFLFFYFYKRYDSTILGFVVAVVFCWVSAEFFIRIFPYEKQNSKKG